MIAALAPEPFPESMPIKERLSRVSQDPWEFMRIVRTKDQVDKETPIKFFPRKEYIKLYTRVWMREPKIAVPKSRRMMMSWTNIILYTWDTMFSVGRHQAFVSKKEEDADDLVDRAKSVVENLDYSQIPKELFPECVKTYCCLKFPQLDSKIEGFPQGADQLRQFTFSGLLFDEFAFWEKAEDAYSSALPTIDGGGRITAISSPAPGFFKRLVFDRLDSGEQHEPGAA